MKSSLAAVGLIVACHTPGTPASPPHTPFDAAQFPPGDGWYCYREEEGIDATPCERVQADCAAKQKKDVHAKSDCVKRDVAYCYSVNEKKACYGESRECENASNTPPAGGGSTSTCGTVK